jgi:hypothetical protein
MIIGQDKVLDWDSKRAAVERQDGRIDLYRIEYTPPAGDAFGLHVATIDGPMKRGEEFVKTGEIPEEHVTPVIWTP